jgi:hypothetical protein
LYNFWGKGQNHTLHTLEEQAGRCDKPEGEQFISLGYAFIPSLFIIPVATWPAGFL